MSKAKGKAASSRTNWKGTKPEGNWETISTGGFAPMWKPSEEGEDVIVRPLAGHVIPKKGKRKESGAVICTLLGGSSESFYAGDKRQGVANGERITIPLSYNLEGEDKLGVHGKGHTELSPLSNYVLANSSQLRIIFDGKVKGGQGSVKRFTIQAPQGVREAVAVERGKAPGKKK